MVTYLATNDHRMKGRMTMILTTQQRYWMKLMQHNQKRINVAQVVIEEQNRIVTEARKVVEEASFNLAMELSQIEEPINHID